MRFIALILLCSAVAVSAQKNYQPRVAFTNSLSTGGGGGGGGADPGGTSLVTSTPSGTPRNDFTACLGFQFTTDGDGMTVSALACWVIAGNSGTHTVRIYTLAGALVTSATVNTSGASPGWYWVSITPVALSASTDYILTSEETNGGDQWYNAHSVTTTSEGISKILRYTADCNSPSFAANTADQSYVGVNLKY